MPIYMEIEGIRGEVTARSNHTGGANFLFADGSVRFIKDSINISSGHKFTLERNFNSDGLGHAGSAIEVSRIQLLNSPFAFDAVNSRDAGATGKVRMLFSTAQGFGPTGGIVISVSKNTLARAVAQTRSHNIKQISLAAHNYDSVSLPALKFLIFDAENSKAVKIELENVKVSSYQISAHGGDTAIFENYSLNFAQIRYEP